MRQGLGSYSRDTHDNIFELLRELKPQQMEDVNYLIVNKGVQNAALGCNLKNDRMISVHSQGKPFNITVIQIYAQSSNAEEAEVERFYEDL